MLNCHFISLIENKPRIPLIYLGDIRCRSSILFYSKLISQKKVIQKKRKSFTVFYY